MCAKINSMAKESHSQLPKHIGASAVLTWFSPLFAPRVDFYKLLSLHAEKTLAGIQALSTWIETGAKERCQIVRDLEHDADAIKMEIRQKLVATFVTPFDREDIYSLSVDIDEILNAAKVTAREIEAAGLAECNHHLPEMMALLTEGAQIICSGVKNLENNLTEASKQAHAASKIDSHFDKIYQKAMAGLFQSDDLKHIMISREIYRCLAKIAERIDLAGDKIAYVIVKLS